MNFWKKSLQGKLISYFLLVSLVAVAIVGAVAYLLARATLEDSIFARLEAVTILKEETISSWMSDRRADVLILARSPQVRALSATLIEGAASAEGELSPDMSQAYVELDETLRDVITRRTDLNEIFILSPTDGRIIYSTNPAHEGEMVTEPYFVEGLNATYLQSMYFDADGRQARMTIATPLRTVEGEAKGVLAAHINLERLQRIVLEEAGLGESGETYLVDQDSRKVTIIDPFVQEISPADALPISSWGIDAVVNGQNGRNLYPNHENIPVLGVYRWLDDAKLGLLAELPEEEAFAPARQVGWAITATGLIGAGILILFITLVSRTISRPIVELTATAVRVAEGDLMATAVVQTTDEIGTLAHTFNQMTEQLRRLYISLEAQVNTRTAELAERVQQLNLINQVGQSAITYRELDELLTEVVKLIRQSFNFYAVGILLVDRQRQEMVLSAADTVENFNISFDKFAIKIEHPSIITQVVKTGKSQVVNDVNQNPYYLADERLPRVQSELGLPLRVGDEVIGVLEIQHSELHAFSPEDVQVLQTLSDQIATAIRNAQLFQAAELARTDAEEANWMKSQFLANMSHELRTPLNAIINFAYLLSLGVDGPLTAEQTDMLNRIGDSGRHLLGLINNILDLAKIESGRFDLHLEKVYLPELIHGVMSTAVGLTRGKPIELRTEVPDDLPLVQVDSNHVRQVLLNLVSNAIKFTDVGQITVRAEANDTEWITVSVIDTGIGMHANEIPKAFSEFVQLNGDMARRVGGTGLGLPITRKFIEMHGGQIWVESEPGMGSAFIFTLPRYDFGPTPQAAQHITKEIIKVVDLNENM